MCKSVDSASLHSSHNFARNSFFHWPKTSLLLTVDAWILFKWQTQCRATGKYVFSPLCQSIALFSAPLTTPQHIIVQIQSNARELKTHFWRCSAHIESLDCLYLGKCNFHWTDQNLCPMVQWQLQPTSMFTNWLCKSMYMEDHTFLYKCTGIRLARFSSLWACRLCWVTCSRQPVMSGCVSIYTFYWCLLTVFFWYLCVFARYKKVCCWSHYQDFIRCIKCGGE